MTLRKILKNFLFIFLLLIPLQFAFSQNQSLEDSLNNLLNTGLPDSTSIKIYLELAKHFQKSDLNKAENNGNIALEISKENNLKTFEIQSLNSLGLSAELKGNFDDAMVLYQQAGQLSKETGNDKLLANSHNNIGTIHYWNGNLTEAINEFIKALKAYENLENYVGVGKMYNNIASVYEILGNNQKALDFHLKGLKIKEEFADQLSIAKSLNNIGNIYGELGDNEKAIEYLEKSLTIKQNEKDSLGMASTISNLGVVYKDLGNTQKAIQHFKQAIEIDLKFMYKEGLCSNYNNLSETYINNKNYSLALENGKKAFAFAEELSLKHRKRESLRNISISYEKMGNYKKSLEAFKAFKIAEDSLIGETTKNNIAELQTKYETEKKDKEIALLNQEKEISDLKIQKTQNQILLLIFLAVFISSISLVVWSRYKIKKQANDLLAKKNDELEVLNATKDKLFALISHDLKNPLSAFKSITSSLSQNLEEISKKDLHFFLQEINQSSNHLLDLLHNLLEWSISQIGRLPYQPRKLNIYQTIDQAIKPLQLQADQKNILLDNVVPEDFWAYADKNMIKTIIRNLISNAIKFTSDKGLVTLSATQVRDFIEISVKDTGIGIEEKDLDKLFRIDKNPSEIGFSSEKGTGIGLLLCKELCEKNGGSIKVKSILGKGSNFIFTIPVFEEEKEKRSSKPNEKKLI